MLIKIGLQYPQNIVFQLILASKGKDEQKKKISLSIILEIKKLHPGIVTQASIVCEELNKIAVLGEEIIYDQIQKIDALLKSKSYSKIVNIFNKMNSIENKFID